MQQAEFNQWWEDFSSRFPGKVKPFNNPQTLKTWAGILADIPLDTAIWASRSLQDGSETMPASWDMIPARVRQIAREAAYEDRQNRQDGQSECHKCGDTGIVRVVNTPRGRLAIVCTCGQGDRHRAWYGRELAYG